MKENDHKLALYLNIFNSIGDNSIKPIGKYNNNDKVGYSHFKNNLNIDSTPPLWRYFDLKGFLSFITSNELHFTRIDKFEDRREGENLYFTKIKSELAQKGDKEEERLEFMKTHDKIFQESCYVNCWRFDYKESPMMWGLYAKNTEGLAIKINYEDFITFIDSLYFKLPIQKLNEKLDIPISNNNAILKDSYVLFLEKVIYEDFDKLLEKDNITIYLKYKFGLIKDIIYSYEKEIRLIIRDKDINSSSQWGLNMPFDKELLKFFTLVFHPKADEWYCNMIENLVKKLDVPITCEKSSLLYR